MLIRTVLFVVFLGSTIDAYKILVLFPMPAHSHQAPAMALTEALIKKGHTVFVVSPIPIPELEKNYTHIDVSSAVPLISEQLGRNSITVHKELSFLDVGKTVPEVSAIAAAQFKTKQFQNFYKRVMDERISFDLVIVESLFLPSLCGMSRLLSKNSKNVPIIAISTLTRDYTIEGELGSVAHFSYLPSPATEFTDQMNLLQKIQNWVICIMVEHVGRWFMDRAAKSYFREVHGPEAEALTEGCWSNASISLISSNFLYYYPRMLGPNVIEVGPLHLKTPERLPKELQDWLDGAKTGVIYFSLGTNMKSINLPDVAVLNLLKVFKQLPYGYRVLWKWELDGPIPGQLDNIMTQKWFPQQSILAHPKVRVFIKQGGIQSFQETVHYGVPTVGIPWAIDQLGSVAKMVHAGVGIRLRPSELETYHKVKTAIEDVLFNESYSKNMKKLSEISHEFTATAIEKAVFWVEHVAKYRDLTYLRPATADDSLTRQLFKFLCLDIIIVILAISLVSLCFCALVLRRFLSSCFSSKSKIKKS